MPSDREAVQLSAIEYAIVGEEFGELMECVLSAWLSAILEEH